VANNPRIVVAALSLSAAAFGGLVAYEGYSDNAIIPIPGDVPTIGFGTTEGVKLGDKITAPKAVARALQDVAKFEGAVKQCVKVPLHQYEYDAALSISYNIGPTAFCNSTMVRKLNAGDYQGFCDGMLAWDKAGGRVVRGLTLRRQRERALCLGQA
jgi:lysozyme